MRLNFYLLKMTTILVYRPFSIARQIDNLLHKCIMLSNRCDIRFRYAVSVNAQHQLQCKGHVQRLKPGINQLTASSSSARNLPRSDAWRIGRTK